MSKAKTKNINKLAKWLPWILFIAGIIGLFCSGVLTRDEVEMLKNPSFQPSCNINPVIACGNVMKSWQADVLGLPNPFFGIAAFSSLTVVGAALLAGARFKKWFWLLLNLGTLLGVIFVHWLFYQTVYQIHALCPYCMGVWVVTITSFWYVTMHNLDQNYFHLPADSQRFTSFIRRHHLDILILWFLIIFALIMKHFWYYYGPRL